MNKHGINCHCVACKNKRGELKGNLAGRYIDGRSSKQYYCIESDCNNKVSGLNRRCHHHAQALRFSNSEEIEKLKGRKAWNKLPRETRYCQCNCGQTFICKITSKQRFILGHHAFGKLNSMFGKKRSEKTKQKISLKHLGKKLSLEHREKIQINVPKQEQHYNWQGEISFEPYPLGWTRTFKEQIRYRDKYICQVCKFPEIEYYRKLDIHHIDYNKNNLNLDNLITLCQSCHSKTNFNRLYWEKYYSIKILDIQLINLREAI